MDLPCLNWSSSDQGDVATDTEWRAIGPGRFRNPAPSFRESPSCLPGRLGRVLRAVLLLLARVLGADRLDVRVLHVLEMLCGLGAFLLGLGRTQVIPASATGQQGGDGQRDAHACN